MVIFNFEENKRKHLVVLLMTFFFFLNKRYLIPLVIPIYVKKGSECTKKAKALIMSWLVFSISEDDLNRQKGKKMRGAAWKLNRH